MLTWVSLYLVVSEERGYFMNSIASIAMKSCVDHQPDWSREKAQGFFDSGAKLIKAIRDYQRANNSVFKSMAVLRHRFWTVVSGADIPLNVKIGGGLMLPHPNGVVIHPKSVIGNNCMIMQQVTLGTNGADKSTPVLGHGVFVGAGAKLVGALTVPNNTSIGCNSVVNKSVTQESDRVWAGIPAKVVS